LTDGVTKHESFIISSNKNSFLFFNNKNEMDLKNFMLALFFDTYSITSVIFFKNL